MLCLLACEKQEADLVFLIDQSGSIDPKDYTTMKNFMTELVTSFKVSEDFVRVGVAQFSSTPQKEFYLNQFYTEAEVNKHILAMHQLGGGTNIGQALDYIREYFQASHGSRISSGISQNLVLITDGDSQDDVEEAAERLRTLGIEVFAIGIGQVHDLELLQITGTPQRLFTVQNFGSLANIKQKVVDTICKSASDAPGEFTTERSASPINIISIFLFEDNVFWSKRFKVTSALNHFGKRFHKANSLSVPDAVKPHLSLL